MECIDAHYPTVAMTSVCGNFMARLRCTYGLGDLPELYGILRPVRAKWKEIGLLLGLSIGDLDAIEKDRQHDTGTCLMSCLDQWLRNGKDNTNERIALILLKVEEPDFALKIYPPVRELWQYTRTWWKCKVKEALTSTGIVMTLIFIVLGAVVHNYSYLIINDGSPQPGESNSLPLVEEELVGRQEEVNKILQFLSDENVKVVTLFGSPGFGKSAIARHIGNLFLRNGTDVHYLVVEDIANVKALKEELLDVSGVAKSIRFASWVRNITKETLIILDNVDGLNWVQDVSRMEFQNHFLSILQSHSHKLKILITSQQEIRSLKHFRSYQLSSLDSENCIHLLSHSIAEAKISHSDATLICDMVGGVPLAVKVIAAILSPPVSTSVSYVITRLNDTLKFYFLAEKNRLDEKKRILFALEVAFGFIKKEHQVCALLSARFTGSFTVDIINSMLTADLMKPYSDDFDIMDCLYELHRKSFIEVISPFDEKKPTKYHFHTLIKSFLEISVSKFNISEVLDMFWTNYLYWINSDQGEEWLILSLAKEDLEVLIKESHKRTNHSYYLAVSITSNRLFVKYINGMFGPVWKHQELYREMLQHSIGSLLSDCEEPGLTFPISSVSRVIHAYSIAFEENVCLESSDCVKFLQICQPKIESLRFLAVGSYDTMKAASYFYNNLLSIKCLEAKLATGGCKSLWKHSLLGVVEMLVEVEKMCTDYCSEFTTEVVRGECLRSNSSPNVRALESYALKEYKEAVQLINDLANDAASSHSCSVLEQVLVYMMMYDIHSSFNDLDEADRFIISIRGIEFQHYNMSCYTAIYDDTVIPFLKDVNETQLAKELRDLKFDSYMAAFQDCEGNPLHCINMRYKTPLLKVLLEFSPLWIEKMLKSDFLLCAVTKEVMIGCESPFPFITDILEAQRTYSQAMRSFLVEG